VKTSSGSTTKQSAGRVRLLSRLSC